MLVNIIFFFFHMFSKAFFYGFISSFPKRQMLNSFKMKDSVDDNFRFDEKGRKFS